MDLKGFHRIAVYLLCLFLALPAASRAELKVHFLDVGQGDAILVQCDGENLLVDAGPTDAGPAVNRYLKDTLGTGILNYVIATHEHDDHFGGMPEALAGMTVGQVWSARIIPMLWWTDLVQPKMAQESLRIDKPAAMSSFVLGGATVTFLNTLQGDAAPNDLSLVVRIDYKQNSVLLTADIETEAEQEMLQSGAPLKADILKVAHHGGNTSSCEAFIRAVAPQTAVISVGKGNKHGHPHAEPLRCLEKYGVAVYRTDESGTIICTGDGESWTIAVEKTR